MKATRLLVLLAACGSAEPGGAAVCLEPQPDGIPVANDGLQCVAREALSGALTLVRGRWPAIALDDCASGEVEIDVPCRATKIALGDAGATITLKCGEKGAKAHALTLEISTPALYFPVCTGQSLRLRYARNEYGCPNGGYSEAMVLRDANTDMVLAATFHDTSQPWVAPIELSIAQYSDCTPTGDSCVAYERSAVQVGDGVAAPVVVYDGTRRIVELDARHVVEAHVVFATSADFCETFGRYEVTLVRVDP